MELLRDTFTDWNKDRLSYDACQGILERSCASGRMPTEPPRPIELYRIYVGFDQIQDPVRQRYFQSLATSFNLPRQQVDDLRAIGKELLEQSPAFKRLVDIQAH